MTASNDISHLIPTADAKLPLWKHLADLQAVLYRGLLAIGGAWVITYYFCDQIGVALQSPILSVLPSSQQHLYFFGVAEKFMVYLKLSLFLAIVVAAPYLVYLIWWFVAPGLYRHEKRLAVWLFSLGGMGFLVGILFGYFFVLPTCYQALINFGSDLIEPRVTLDQYFGLTTKILLCAGLVFEVPIILFLLVKYGLVDLKALSNDRKRAFFFILTMAAIINPSSDVLTMSILVIPIWALFEVTLFVARLFRPRVF